MCEVITCVVRDLDRVLSFEVPLSPNLRRSSDIVIGQYPLTDD